MPKVVAEYRDQARERIVRAARSVFRRQGFRSASMADIAREIGVSKGALYLYFRTKTDLLAEIQRQAREQVMGSWERLLERGDVAEGIAASLDDVFSGAVDPGVWHELIAAAGEDPAVRAAMVEDYRVDVRTMRDFLRRLEAKGRIRPLADRGAAAEIIIALLRTCVLDLLLQGRPADTRKSLVRSLRYLLAPPA
jgi:AcrR family transcriptional regulator